MLRKWSVLVVLVSIVFGTAAAGPGGAAGAATPGSQSSIVDEVRYTVSGRYVVQHDILIDTRIAPDPGAVADQVAGPSLQPAGEVTAQYALNATKWLPSSMPIPVSYNPSLESPRPSLVGPIRNAIDQWSSVTPETFRFVYAGTTSAQTGACDGSGISDGINTIAYVSTLPQGTLGQTCTLTEVDNNTGQGTIFEFDTELNWSIAWGGLITAPDQYDIYSTVLHEMGHAAGLAHPCIPGVTTCTPSDQAAVMYASLRAGVEKRALTADDMAGLRADYPGGAPPLPTPPPFQRLFDVGVAAVSRD